VLNLISMFLLNVLPERIHILSRKVILLIFSTYDT
jgi:hypothetical protein